MQSPPIPANEIDRLAALCELNMLDTAPEPRFDRITRIARALFEVPIALVSFIDVDRQWFKSSQGLALSETPRSISFCGHAILHSDIFIVSNALADKRFADNPLVTGPPHIRFYAGIPLSLRDGLHVGTLCIIDNRPRNFTDEQMAQLTDLAQIIEEELAKKQLNEVTRLYHAEQKRVRESDSLLKTIAENSPCLLGYWTKELRCGFANREYVTWFGRTPEQMKGIHIQDLMGPDLFQKNLPYIRAVLGGDDQQFERTLVKANGETGFTLARYIAHKINGEVQGFFVLVSDITTIKLASEKLQKSEARNQAMLSAIPDLIFTTRQDGEILDCHAPDPSRLFCPLEALLHQKIVDVLPQPAADLLTRACANALYLQAVQEVHYSLPTADGKEAYFEVRVAPCAEDKVISIVRDVTDRELDRRSREFYTAQLSDRLHLSEADLREREKTLALAADAANLGAWVLYLVRDELFPSEEWRRLFAFPLSQPLTSASLLQRVHPEDVSAFSENIRAALRAEGLYENTYRIVLPDGVLRWVHSRGRVEFDNQGQPVVVRGVSVDVTARKQAELDLQQKQKEITHLSRVSMLGELSGALAHELNQPLTAILSNAQAAQRFLAKDDIDLNEVRDILQDIVDEDKRAGEVIRRLRRLFDKSEILHQIVDVNELVLDVVRILRNDLINHGVTLKTEFSTAVTNVSVDRVQLQQVLINLMVNGCDAMASLNAADRLIAVRTSVTVDGSVQVSVIDQGVGIPVASLERIFEPFYTTKESGMGLGLSICRNIVSANGGRFWAENNPERGASFHIRMPRLPEEIA